jgi:hypothetical protein
VNLPKTVQRLPENKLVDPKTLKVGDRFVLKRKVWAVSKVKHDGLDCAQDPTFFFIEDVAGARRN